MKKLSICFVSLALLSSLPAFADSVCPSAGSGGGFGSDVVTAVPGPLDSTSCGTNSAVNLSITSTTDYARVIYTPGVTPGVPSYATLGNFTGAAATVDYTGNDEPYYMLTFVDPTGSLGQTNASDEILMLNFQPSTLSGNNMDLDTSTSLFNMYDNTDGFYLNGVHGQQVVHTLDDWLALYPFLANDPITGLRIAIGLGGSNVGPVNLTINTLDISATPEPSSVLLLGTGILGMAFLLRRKLLAV